MTNVVNTERLAQIKAVLPPGGQAAIAAHLGTSRAAVCQVLAGTRQSPRIADGIMRWFLDWAANRPKVSQVDEALEALQAQSRKNQGAA